MRNIKSTVLLSLLFFVMLFGTSVYCSESIDKDKNVSYTINYRYENAPISGATFRIYKVADISSKGGYELTNEFSKYSVSLDNANLSNTASTLSSYVSRDNIAAFDSGKTDSKGVIKFPNSRSDMKAGLYLVLSDSYVSGRTTYSTKPALVSLPNKNSNSYDYNITSNPKVEMTSRPGGSGGGGTPSKTKVEVKVLKVWDDEGHETSRPTSIEVQLLKDGEVYQTIKLNKAGNWRNTWTGLDADHEWTVVEKDVPEGYQVSTDKEGITYVITNKYVSEETTKPENPSEPTTAPGENPPGNPSDYPPGGPGNPGDSDNPNNPDNPSEPGTTDDSGMLDGDADNLAKNGPGYNPDGNDSMEGGNNLYRNGGSNRNGGNSGNNGRLPQTGLLWWPVPIMAIGGILLFILGWARYQKKEIENEV